MQSRREQIAKIIKSRGEVSIAELESMFSDVSSMTIRRDLDYLEEHDEIIRVRGGVKSISHLSGMIKEDVYSRRALINMDSKIQIAQKAIAQIGEANSIYLDPGSTVMSLAKIIPEDSSYFIVTSAPNIALELVKNSNCQISVVGGELNRENIAISGTSSIEFVSGINIEIAFIAASGFSPETGFTCGYRNEADLKRFVIASAKKKVILMDSSKVGKNMPFTFAKPEDFDVFITDDKISDNIKKYMKNKNVKTI